MTGHVTKHTAALRTSALLGAALLAAIALALPLPAGAHRPPRHQVRASQRESAGATPRNGRIFFSTGFVLPNPDLSGNWQVYSVRPDGSRLRQLTHVPDGSQAGDPSVSPDGTQVAYVSNQSGQFDLWVMNARGDDQTQVLSTPDTNYYTPSWSPHGQRLVVAACDSSFGFDGWCDLVTMRPDGSDQRTLLADLRHNFYAEYSPNGRWLEFSSDRRGDLGAVWVMPARGGTPRRVTPPWLESNGATWAPDGRHIVTGSNCCQAGGNLYRISITGRHLTQLTHAVWPRGAGSPSFSPDGRLIAFNSDMDRTAQSQKIDLFTMRPDGTHIRQIETSEQPAVLVSWGQAPAPSKEGRP
jgi:Tol biopolymer transport system component